MSSRSSKHSDDGRSFTVSPASQKVPDIEHLPASPVRNTPIPTIQITSGAGDPISIEDASAHERPSGHRFRNQVRKVINANVLLESLKGDGKAKARRSLRTPGAAPGVDVRRPQPELEALFSGEAQIRITDYCATRCESHDLSRSALAEFLQRKRPDWVKCRWIDVKGLNYQCIGTLAAHYKLHPLSIEDVFHYPQAIKADWYDSHIYISHVLCSMDDTTNPDPAPDLAVSTASLHRTPLFRNRIQIKVFDGMPPRPSVNVEQLNVFLMRDGTLISIFQNDGLSATNPLYGRLEEQGTLIRNCEDASFLLFALIDVVTDHFFPIVDAYKRQLDLLEAYVLQEPIAEATKELHLIAKELAVLRKTLMPTRTLVASLRENGKALYTSTDPVATPFISKLARTYLADVRDHASTVVDGLEGFEGDARNLIDLIFNTTSHSTNEAMRTLALVSLIFLPISFLAGVFGMNFDHFPELHSDTSAFWSLGVYAFWIIVAILCLAMVIAFRYMGWLGKTR
ncbi:hypothetical protein HKX48_004031 [Thoreauomyces humboldtii]|nr:hypothetical protein HKX48_004031 [Thoreauomyces humboldtii]